MIIILTLAILGFINAYYLHYQYKQYKIYGKKMFCLIGGKCEDVVSSQYGTTLGIKNELIGMTYYGLLIIYSLVGILLPDLVNSFAFGITIIKIITVIATIFSIYLLFAQTIVLKTLCSWCLIAIFINLLIFYLLTLSPNSLINLSIFGFMTNWQ